MMGDRRFDPLFERVRDAEDRVAEIRELTDDEVIAALGGASRHNDPLLANILATEAQNRFQRASELSSALGEGVIVMDKDWRITQQNPAAERMLGWTSAEFVGHDPHALIHPFCTRPSSCHLGSVPGIDFFYQNDDGLVNAQGRAHHPRRVHRHAHVALGRGRRRSAHPPRLERAQTRGRESQRKAGPARDDP